MSQFKCPVCMHQAKDGADLYGHLGHHVIVNSSRYGEGQEQRCIDDTILEMYKMKQSFSQSCKYCNFPFYRQVDLSRRMQAKHEARLRCHVAFCPFVTKDEGTFGRHCKKHNLKFGCTAEGCDEWFALRQEYLDHRSTHPSSTRSVVIYSSQKQKFCWTIARLIEVDCMEMHLR